MSYKYRHLAVGGTFDLLHRGHRAFLEAAFDLSREVSIGITTDRMAKDNGKIPVQNFSARLVGVKKFLEENKFTTRSKIVPLKTIYGSTLADKTIEGLVVTEETLRGGLLINKKRQELILPPLRIIHVPLVRATDGKSISTSRIKQGVINREGISFYRFLMSKKQLVLPGKLRSTLAKPLGDLFPNINNLTDVFRVSKGSLLITVGDEITRVIAEKKMMPNLAVVDFKVERKNKFKSLLELGFEKDQKFTLVKNDAGTISKPLIRSVWEFFQKKLTVPFIVKVIGEEDLAVLPVVLLAPLSCLVIYGQRNKGLVLVKVTEQKKAEFVKILKQFD